MSRIGLLLYDYSLFGGAEKVALSIANELSRYHDVYVISCFNKNEVPVYQLKETVNTHILSKKTLSISLNIFKLSGCLKKYLISNKIDILISITAGVNSIGILSTSCTNIKTIYAEHSNLLNKTYGKKHQFRQWLGSKFCDYIVTLTESDKEEFIKKYNIKDKCDFIYNWYDEEFSNKPYNLNSKKIISVGRLEKVKGYDRLIQVAKIVLKEHCDWQWDIYGDGSFRSELEDLIKNNNLENRLILRGNHPNVKDLYKNYSFFVMTSYYEGLPLVLLEAKSNYLPIVSFDCPTGPSEIITDGYDGYLIENGNCDLMATKINNLINDQEIRIKFSNNSTNIIHKFDKQYITQKWLNLIDNVQFKRTNK